MLPIATFMYSPLPKTSLWFTHAINNALGVLVQEITNAHHVLTITYFRISVFLHVQVVTTQTLTRILVTQTNHKFRDFYNDDT